MSRLSSYTNESQYVQEQLPKSKTAVMSVTRTSDIVRILPQSGPKFNCQRDVTTATNTKVERGSQS